MGNMFGRKLQKICKIDTLFERKIPKVHPDQGHVPVSSIYESIPPGKQPLVYWLGASKILVQVILVQFFHLM